MEIISKEEVFRFTKYGDGYNGYVITFDEPITYEDFIEFCKQNDLRLNKLDNYVWYEDHAHVSPSTIKSEARWNEREQPSGKPGDVSKVWTYLWIHAYTD